MGTPARQPATPDATWYPETDDMGEHELQRFIAELLRPLIARWLGAQGRVAHAGADQFFYGVPGDTSQRRAPDVYVVDGVAQDAPEVGVWKVWEGHRPAFALEICGDDWQKDYDEAPAEYGAMGVTELIVFDPGATVRSRRRVRWQVFRRSADGAFARVVVERGNRVASAVLGAWLRVVDERGHVRLRLGTGAQGEVLFPTEAEAALAREEAALAREEAALAEVARLRAELESLTARR